jgi:hypothetical protein
VRFEEGAAAPSGGLTLVSLYVAAAQAPRGHQRQLRRGRLHRREHRFDYSGAATWMAGG